MDVSYQYLTFFLDDDDKLAHIKQVRENERTTDEHVSTKCCILKFLKLLCPERSRRDIKEREGEGGEERERERFNLVSRALLIIFSSGVRVWPFADGAAEERAH